MYTPRHILSNGIVLRPKLASGFDLLELYSQNIGFGHGHAEEHVKKTKARLTSSMISVNVVFHPAHHNP